MDGQGASVMQNKNLRIFIAEDDPIEMAGFCAILRDFGYQVAGQANTGRNAVAGVRQTQPDLILMDINMPETDGLTALEEINRERIIPCIIITGYKDPTLTERASQAGVFGYLQKPIDEYEIRSAIEIALRRFNEYEQLRAQLEASKQALADRKVLDRAKGILMDTMGMTEQQAMNFLQKKSRDTNKKLADVARQVIAREEALRF